MLNPIITRLPGCKPKIAKKPRPYRKQPAVYPSVVNDHPLCDKRHALAVYDLDLMVRPAGAIPGRAFRCDRVLWSVDVETTGLNHYHDRIVQLAAVPYHPDGTRGPARVWFFCPDVEVSPGAEAVHHLSRERLQHEPKFDDVAKDIYDTLKDGDLLGYNIKAFDIRMMRNAFSRLGYTFPQKETRIIDAFRIFRSNVTRDSAGGNHKLTTAHKFYCNTDFQNAHDAEADSHATLDVLLRQVAVHRDVPVDVAGLHTYTHARRPHARIDAYRRPPVPQMPKLRPYIRAPLWRKLESEAPLPIPPLAADLSPSVVPAMMS